MNQLKFKSSFIKEKALSLIRVNADNFDKAKLL